MADHLSTEKIGAKPYHHGALRAALIEAAATVIAERGVDSFSLRETARRAGVSAAAPAHHFKDARGLLTALAADGFRRFGERLEAADVDRGRLARIRAMGMAYVRFALAEPARFDLMWRFALIDRDDPDYRSAADHAFALLDRVVRGEPAEGSSPDDLEAAPSIAAWSMVHGFARLALDGAFGSGPKAAEKAAERLLPRVLDHLGV